VILKELIQLIYRNELPNQERFTREQMNTFISSQKLWMQLAYGMRSLMLSVLRDPDRTESSANRLFYYVTHNFNDYFRFFYGPEVAQNIVNYLTIFISHMWGLFNVIGSNNPEEVNSHVLELYKNADEASAFFARINPYWNEQQWKNFLRQHIELIIAEAVALAGKDFDTEFQILSQLEDLSSQIGDYTAMGILSKGTAPPRT
jgi:hypothetical protein